jgi:O-methyltransferase
VLGRLYEYARRSLGMWAVPPVVRAVRAASITYLDDAALVDLFNEVRTLEASLREGILIEAGCALGGSAIVIATAKSPQRPLFVYDIFGMIPAPSEHDDADVHERYHMIQTGQSQGLGGNRYYGYEENLLETVTGNFRRHGVPVGEHNVHLVKGLFHETLRVRQPVALAHIDGDWYESVMTSLQRIEPHLARHGVLVIDDYYAWSGCRKAVDEYFSDKRDRYEFIRKARLHVVPRRMPAPA